MYNIPMKYLECMIKSGLFQYIDKSGYIRAYEEMEIVERSFEKGEMVFCESDVMDWICIVRKGSVRTEKNYPNGDIHIIAVFDEDMIFCLEVAMSRTRRIPTDVIANEPCRILFVSIRSLESSNLGEPVRRAMIEKLADENIRMMHKIEILAERGLRDRILIYLNVLARKSGSDQVTVRMSREQMAQFLCVNRSALSNELNRMKREGVIDFDRTQFRLLNRAEGKDGKRQD